MTNLRNVLLVCVLAVLASPLAAQNDWDTSGNNLLNGTYYYRDVIWVTDFAGSNDLDEAAAQYGTIAFDGNGNYHLEGTAYSSTNSQMQNITLDGTYRLAASGFGFITRPEEFGGVVYGAVAQGIFIGSSTESDLNNLFAATERSTTPLTTATFNRSYEITYLNFPNLDMSQARDASFRLQPNGSGGLAAINLVGYIGADRTPVTQNIGGATYSVASGVGTLNFGGTITASNLLAGSQEFYASPDGSFIFGGSRTGYDMFVGILTPTGAVPGTALDRLFFQAAAEVDRSPLPANPAVLDSYYGAFKGAGGTLLGHQRLLVAPQEAYDYTYSDEYSLDATGRLTDFLGYSLIVSQDGRFRIGFGEGDWIGITVAMALPDFSGTGPFINPAGVINAASYTPFTAGLAPGTVISIFGTDLTTSTQFDATFPTTLGGSQVEINGTLAPMYYASPTQISVVIPYSLGNAVVGNVRVIRGGTPSNSVPFFVNTTSPGVFTQNASGVGYAAALHPDYSLITPQNPARPNEIVQIFLTGMGAVNPPNPAGAPGPAAEPLSRVVAATEVVIDQADSFVHFAGLAPTLGGLYQINAQVPASARMGDQYLEVAGPDAYNSQVLIPVGATALSLSEASAGARAASRTRVHSGRSARRGAAAGGPRRPGGRSR